MVQLQLHTIIHLLFADISQILKNPDCTGLSKLVLFF